MSERCEEALDSEGHAPSLSCGDAFMELHICQTIQFCTSNVCGLLHIHFTTIKL